MKEHQVYARHTKLLQRLVRSRLDILGLTVDDSIILEVVPKLGSDEDLITLASALAPFSNQFFVVIVAICGVPERAPAFVGSIEHL